MVLEMETAEITGKTQRGIVDFLSLDLSFPIHNGLDTS